MISLLAHTPEPEKIVAAAAKNCYSGAGAQALMDGLDDVETEKFLKMFMSLGHESVLEHVSFTFSVDGVSRSLLAQITRHRIASFSVKSQRYVGEKSFERVTPQSIAENREALKLYEAAMKAAEDAYGGLIELRIPKEDARFVLPNACATNILFTMNARELRHFFRLRCCNRAQWEIRELACNMLALVKKAAPLLFNGAGPACVRGACPEGGMTCGRADEVRKKFT